MTDEVRLKEQIEVYVNKLIPHTVMNLWSLLIVLNVTEYTVIIIL